MGPKHLDTILHFHYQKALLSQKNLIDKREDSQPKHRSDVDPKSRWNISFHNSQERFCWPGNNIPRSLVEICLGVP